MGPPFVEALPIGRYHGVGPATEAKMGRMGIANGVDLKTKSLAFLQQHFGKSGSYFCGIARGIDHRPVRADRVRKSIGAENTFMADLIDDEPMREALRPIIDKVWCHCEMTGVRGRTVTLKIKFSDFSQITRSRSEINTIARRDLLEASVHDLLSREMPLRRAMRLLGISLSNLETKQAGRPTTLLFEA
jgi:DNA polymerase-4